MGLLKQELAVALMAGLRCGARIAETGFFCLIQRLYCAIITLSEQFGPIVHLASGAYAGLLLWAITS